MLEAISQAQLSPAEAADEERVARIGAANVYAGKLAWCRPINIVTQILSV